MSFQFFSGLPGYHVDITVKYIFTCMYMQKRFTVVIPYLMADVSCFTVPLNSISADVFSLFYCLSIPWFCHKVVV